MSKQHQHIKTLRRHNKWRRGASAINLVNPTELGIAIDWTIKVVELAQKYVEAKSGSSAARFYDLLVDAINEGADAARDEKTEAP